ncbi:MAG: response regulator transcription factor [Elusimicrobia bacterium]|nr:response regulator transcription factor [Elusimicrobiota bacterium]
MNAMNDGSIKISLIEPVAGDVAWISELARSGDASVDVTDEIAAERPDIAGAEIILLGLQDLGEVEIEALTRLHAGFPETPLIVLAGPGVAGRAGEAVGFGAQHVLLKSELTPSKLSSALRYYLRYAPGELTHTA